MSNYKQFQEKKHFTRGKEQTFNVKKILSKKDLNRVFKLVLNGIKTPTLFDTGADVNLVDEGFCQENGWSLRPTTEVLTTLNGSETRIKQELDVELVFGDKTVIDKAFVVPNFKYKFLIGTPSMTDLQIKWDLKSGMVCNSVEKEFLCESELKRLFPSLISGEKQNPKFKVNFTLKPDASIVRSKPYRLSNERLRWVQDKIQELKKKEIIQD